MREQAVSKILYYGCVAKWLTAAGCKLVTLETLVVRIHPHPPSLDGGLASNIAQS